MPCRERPILFKAEMVRAILDGRKTQTRRIVNKILGYREFFFDDDRKIIDAQSLLTRRGTKYADAETCPYGRHGDRLWVRETFQIVDNVVTKPHVFYAADEGLPTTQWPEGLWNVSQWRPSIFMPRWASRLTLEITGVRVERLQDITDDDCFSEGIAAAGDALGNPRAPYRDLWDTINGKRAPWSSNPFVWVISFTRLDLASQEQAIVSDNGLGH